MKPYTPPPKVELLDFTHLTRNAGKVFMEISLRFGYEPAQLWIRLAEGDIRKYTQQERTSWEVGAYLLNASDFEHDAAHTFRFRIVGVEFDSLSWGVTRLGGWLHGGYDDSFQVPPADYNPLKNATKCKAKGCKPHPVVGEGFYVPRANKELYQQVRGAYVEIRYGAVIPESKE